MCIVYDPTGSASRAVIVPIERPLSIAARHKDAGIIKSDGQRLVLMWRNGQDRGKVVPATEEFFCQPARKEIAGKFPDWRRVVPSDPTKLQPGHLNPVNPKYIKRVCETGEMIAKFGGSKYGIGVATNWTAGPQGAIITRFETYPNCIVVSMPMSAAQTLKPVADWADLPPKTGTGVEIKAPASGPMGRTTSGAIGQP
jgi:hypothetical protein